MTRPPLNVGSSARDEAAAWVARLQRRDRDIDTDEALQRWLASDPEHAREFDKATLVWEALGGIATVEPRPARRVVAGLAIAASLAVAVVGTLLARPFLFAPTRAYATAVGQQMVVSLDDGTRLTLNTDTRLKVRFTPKRRVVDLERGEAMFEVAKNPARPFDVRSSNRLVTALGTAFTVYRSKQDLSVMLMEGRVSITPLSGPERRASPDGFTLRPGEQWSVSSSRISPVSAVQVAKALAWRDHRIVMDSTPLADAIAQMNRYSDLQIVLTDRRVAGLPVSGVFRSGDNDAFAHAVADLHSLTLSRQGDQLRLSPERR